MTTRATQAAADSFLHLAEAWFTRGWRGELAMAQDIFSEDLKRRGLRADGPDQ